jgi:hypothetical protein
MYIHTYIYSDRENQTVLVSPSEGLWEVGERKNMLENEKYWNTSSIHEYNIMHCAVSCWMLGEHGEREWESDGGEGLLWSKHDI